LLEAPFPLAGVFCRPLYLQVICPSAASLGRGLSRNVRVFRFKFLIFINKGKLAVGFLVSFHQTVVCTFELFVSLT
jgi:hypothetical protein